MLNDRLLHILNADIPDVKVEALHTPKRKIECVYFFWLIGSLDVYT